MFHRSAHSASSSMDAAVTRLFNAGVVVVVAAGNSATSLNDVSPARAAAAITVTALSAPAFGTLSSPAGFRYALWWS